MSLSYNYSQAQKAGPAVCSQTRYGYDLYLIDGPGENIKITTPEDFYTMRAILEAKENEQIYGLE